MTAYSGRDFRQHRLENGLNHIDEVTTEGSDGSEYELLLGEKFFLCTKS